jgi:hypothetical protein
LNPGSSGADDLLIDANLFVKQRLLEGRDKRRFFAGGMARCCVFDVRLQVLILEHVPKTANRKSEILYWYLAA